MKGLKVPVGGRTVKVVYLVVRMAAGPAHDPPHASSALERVCTEERLEWYRMTPARRWAESQQLWDTYLAMGGRLDPEPDLQSPFHDPRARGPEPPDGRPGLHPVRRSGV
jgi:hypothetical protein